MPAGNECTVNLLSTRTGRSEQTMQNQVRLLLKKQSDQVLHSLPFYLHRLGALLHCEIKLFHFMSFMTIILDVQVYIYCFQ